MRTKAGDGLRGVDWLVGCQSCNGRGCAGGARWVVGSRHVLTWMDGRTHACSGVRPQSSCLMTASKKSASKGASKQGWGGVGGRKQRLLARRCDEERLSVRTRVPLNESVGVPKCHSPPVRPCSALASALASLRTLQTTFRRRKVLSGSVVVQTIVCGVDLCE